jgi:putative peptidoglycan lipid II flippase
MRQTGNAGKGLRQDTPRQAAFWKVTGTLVAKIIGFLGDIIVASLFGMNAVVDVTLLAEDAVTTVIGFVTAPISIPLVPELTSARQNGGDDERALLSSVLSLFLLVGAVMLAVGAIWPHLYVLLFASGFTGSTEAYAEYAFRWMAPIALFMVVTTTVKTALAVRKDFAVMSFSDALMNLAIIAGLLLGARKDALPAVKTASYMCAALLVWVYFWLRSGWALLPSLRRLDARVGMLLRQAGPLFIGSATDVLLTLIDRRMASHLTTGSIASIDYASKIYLLPLGIWALQIAEAAYPYLVQAFVEGNVRHMNELARTSLHRILFFLLPAFAGILLLGEPVIRLLFQRGAFTAADTERVGTVLQGYSGLMLFTGVQYIQTRLFYTRRNTTTPMLVGVTALAANVGLNYLLGFVWGLGAFGLAIASSIAALISVSALYLIYRRMYAKVGWGLLIPAVMRMSAATAVMSVAVWLLRDRVHILPLIAFAALIYMSAAFALRDEEARSYARLVAQALTAGIARIRRR